MFSNEEIDLMLELLANARAEVDVAALPDSMVRPDDGMALMRHYDMSKVLSQKLGAVRHGADLVSQFIKIVASCPRCESCRSSAIDLQGVFDRLRQT